MLFYSLLCFRVRTLNQEVTIFGDHFLLVRKKLFS